MTAPATGGASALPTAPGAVPGRRERGPTALTAFLGCLLLLAAVYTQLAMGLEWRTQAGRIGPGFFPRIVGTLTVILCFIAAVQSARVARAARASGTSGAAEAPGAPDERHPGVLLVAVGAAAAFFVLLVPLGAILASALFLLVLLQVLGRGHLLLNVAVSVLVPIGLYLLFQVLLNSGLPKGLLPLL